MPGLSLDQVARNSSLAAVTALLTPPAATPAYLLADEDAFPGSATLAVGNTLTSLQASLPEYGRNLTMQLDNVGASTGDVTIRVIGLDQFGMHTQEDFRVSKALGVVTGTKIFKVIDRIKVVTVTAATVANDLIDLGFGDYLGLPTRVASFADVRAITRRKGPLGRQVINFGNGLLDNDNHMILNDLDISSWTAAGEDVASEATTAAAWQENTAAAPPCSSGQTVAVRLSNAGASTANFTLTATGVDPNGNTVTEDIVINAEAVFQGAVVFSSVSQLQITASTVDPGANDLLNVGWGNGLGLPVGISQVSDVKKIMRSDVSTTAAANHADAVPAALPAVPTATEVKIPSTSVPYITAIGSNGGVFNNYDAFSVCVDATGQPTAVAPSASTVQATYNGCALRAVGSGPSGAIVSGDQIDVLVKGEDGVNADMAYA